MHIKGRGLAILPILYSYLPQSESNLKCDLGTTLPFHMLYAGSPVNPNKRSCYKLNNNEPWTLTKGSWTLDSRLNPSTTQVSQRADGNGWKQIVYDLLQLLFSTGSKFKSDFITDFQREDKNWQNVKTPWGFTKSLLNINGVLSRNSKHPKNGQFSSKE